MIITADFEDIFFYFYNILYIILGEIRIIFNTKVNKPATLFGIDSIATRHDYESYQLFVTFTIQFISILLVLCHVIDQVRIPTIPSSQYTNYFRIKLVLKVKTKRTWSHSFNFLVQFTLYK